MSRVLVTGSADGLGRLAAEALAAQGHDLVVHARSGSRAGALRAMADGGAEVVVGDLAVREDVHRLADELGRLHDQRPIDAVIHNAGVFTGPAIMPVNVVAPYLLTALFPGPRRLVYLTSGMHRSGTASLARVDWRGRRAGSYSDSKLFVTALALAVARRRPEVVSNAVDPGWVPTRMGGAGAPDDLDLGHETQEWLAVSDDPAALTSGGYWFHRERHDPHPAAADPAFQDELLASLAAATGEVLD